MRIISVIGLGLLTLLGVLIIVISLGEGDWKGIFIAIGLFSIIAFFADALRTERLKRDHPEASVAPSRKVLGFFFLCAGVGMLVSGINNLLASNWWSAAKEIILAVVVLSALFAEVYLGFRRKI